LAFSICCFGSVGCATLNPPANNRIYDAKQHHCVCQELPEGFNMEEAYLVGGGLWLEHVEVLERCKQVLEIK
jgi:hypothetical protein